MTEDQIEEAEKLLGYYEIHLATDAPHPAGEPHRGWNHEEMAALLREMLPEWSAFKRAPKTCCHYCGNEVMQIYKQGWVWAEDEWGDERDWQCGLSPSGRHGLFAETYLTV